MLDVPIFIQLSKNNLDPSKLSTYIILKEIKYKYLVEIEPSY